MSEFLKLQSLQLPISRKEKGNLRRGVHVIVLATFLSLLLLALAEDKDEGHKQDEDDQRHTKCHQSRCRECRGFLDVRGSHCEGEKVLDEDQFSRVGNSASKSYSSWSVNCQIDTWMKDSTSTWIQQYEITDHDHIPICKDSPGSIINFSSSKWKD